MKHKAYLAHLLLHEASLQSTPQEKLSPLQKKELQTIYRKLNIGVERGQFNWSDIALMLEWVQESQSRENKSKYISKSG